MSADRRLALRREATERARSRHPELGRATVPRLCPHCEHEYDGPRRDARCPACHRAPR